MPSEYLFVSNESCFFLPRLRLLRLLLTLVEAVLCFCYLSRSRYLPLPLFLFSPVAIAISAHYIKFRNILRQKSEQSRVAALSFLS